MSTCLRSVSNGFWSIECREEFLNGNVYDFLSITVLWINNILNIHKYLKTNYKINYVFIE